MTAPVSTYQFAWGFSDAAVQIQPSHYTPIWPLVAALNPAYWRIEVPWNNVATALSPGPFKSASKAVVTATATGSGFIGNARTNGSSTAIIVAIGTGAVAGVSPAASGRDWSYVDVCINDIRLQVGCDIILMIGGGMPSGWADANYQEFCAEVAVRYGPGGPGIRTDGEYAPNAGWGVTHFEIWNEENNEVLWAGGNVDPTTYTKLLIAGSIGIKSVLPGTQSTVIFGGMQHTQFVGQWFGYGWITMDEYSFLRQCYAAAVAAGTTLGAHVDKFATHLYPSDDTAYSGSVISGLNLPCSCTTGPTTVAAQATGSGRVNIPSLPNHGRLQSVTLASGTGQLNQYQPPGPVPSMFMDNFRQIQGVYALMQANGDGTKKLWITEMGYTPLDPANGVGITAQTMSTYTKACWDLLNTLPYIETVLIYNVLDISNATKNDAINGYGAIDVTDTPRPIYNWLLTVKPPISGSGSAMFSATATGTGQLAGQGAPVITVLTANTAHISLTGAFITFTAQGAGLFGLGDTGILVVQAAATGAGTVALIGTGGVPGVAGGGIILTATAVGVGRQGVNPSSNGDALVVAAAFGGGTVTTQQAAGPEMIVAMFTSTTMLVSIGSEIGVVGEVTGGALTAIAAIFGAGYASESDTGSLGVTAAGTGAGHVGAVGAGVLTETATEQGTGITSLPGLGPQTVTMSAVGNGVIGTFGQGQLTIVEVASGSRLFVYTDMGAQVETAIAAGVGVIGVMGAAAPVMSAVATASVSVTEFLSGTAASAATATGVGLVGLGGGAATTVTALATGVGQVGLQGAGVLTVSPLTTASQFAPFTVTTSQPAGTPVPQGAYGFVIDHLSGPGGNGGGGGNASGSNTRGGGGGGGGGAEVGSGLILASDLGTTYSLSISTSDGVPTVFASGSVTLTAGCGSDGSGGGGSGGSGGAAGVASAVGLVNSQTPPLNNGTPGGGGGTGTYGGTPAASTNGAGSGGTGGSGASGGNSTGTSGANSGTASPGGNGGYGGAAGGSPSSGGAGTNFGGGGGGGGAGHNSSGIGSGGQGAPGDALLTWVGPPIAGYGVPVTVFCARVGVGVVAMFTTGQPSSVTASITGSGQIGGPGSASPTFTATATGTGQQGEQTYAAPVTTATITGAGFISTAMSSPVFLVTASSFGAGQKGAVGVGSVAVSAAGYGAAVIGTVGGSTQAVTAVMSGVGYVADSNGGQLPVTAAAAGVGRVAITQAEPVDMLTAVITGTGAVGVAGSATMVAAAAALGVQTLTVVGTAAPVVTATINGTAFQGDTAVVFIAAAATGVGTVAIFSSGTLSAAATAAGTGTGTYVGSGTPVIVNAGALGVTNLSIAGAPVMVTAIASGSALDGDVTTGILLATASAQGAGFVAIAAPGSPLAVTALASGSANTVVTTTTGPCSVSAGATGTGTMAAADGGTLPATASITGTGAVGLFTAGPLTYPNNGTYTYTTPPTFATADVITLGAGGGSNGTSFGGQGSAAGGSWAGATFPVGSPQIPAAGTVLTITVGAGPGRASGNTPGGTGGSSSVTSNALGTPTLETGAGGGNSGSSSPGNFTLNGVTYIGGAAAGNYQDGNPPGGGGGAEASSYGVGYAGADGQVWIQLNAGVAVAATATGTGNVVGIGTPPSVASVGTNYGYGAGRTAAAIPVPSGVTGVATDIVVVYIYTDANTLVTPPAGFTEATNSPVVESYTAEPFDLHVFWKRPTAADTGTYTFTHASTGNSGIAIRVSGCIATGNPFETVATNATSTETTTSPAVSVTTTYANDMLLWIGINYAGSPYAVASGFTNIINTADGAGLQSKPLPSAGASGSVAPTYGSTNATAAAWLGALLGAGTAVGFPYTFPITLS